MEVTEFFSEVAPGVGPEPPLKEVYEAGPKADAVICQGGLQRKKQMKNNPQYYPRRKLLGGFKLDYIGSCLGFQLIGFPHKGRKVSAV